MKEEEALLAGIIADPHEDTGWLVLADWLEERNDPRAEILRLVFKLKNSPREEKGTRKQDEQTIIELIRTGVRPCVPTIRNSIGMEFVLLPAGEFRMGSPVSEESREEIENIHFVKITHPYFIGKYQVTQLHYSTVMGNNPSYFSEAWFNRDDEDDGYAVRRETSHHPVERVDYAAAVAFCNALSDLPEERELQRKYRLPTEAEWEYACRAGTHSPYWFGRTSDTFWANFDGNYPYGNIAAGQYHAHTTPVGSYPPNAFGLFDMHGNVWEWCLDWFGEYDLLMTVDPRGPVEGTDCIIRGGSWDSYPRDARCAHRRRESPEFSHAVCGFRVVCEMI
jgi:uncharacterized protein (TIGR02996 family)